jgi:hypothetical protein
LVQAAASSAPRAARRGRTGGTIFPVACIMRQPARDENDPARQTVGGPSGMQNVFRRSYLSKVMTP